MSIQRVVVAGLIASLVMGMLEMAHATIAGTGFWSPVVFIAATIVRGLQSVFVPVAFQPLPVVLGLMGHMMNSLILAAIFSWLIAPRLRGLSALVAGSVVYSLLVFFLMWYVIVPLVDPVMLNLNPLVFTISHMMWGAALGLILGWRPAGELVVQTAH
jgi:hypothetical protein